MLKNNNNQVFILLTEVDFIDFFYVIRLDPLLYYHLYLNELYTKCQNINKIQT